MKKKYLPFLVVSILLIGLVLSLAQMDVAHADATTDYWQKLLLGDKITDRNNKQDIGYMEEMLAGLITAIPRWIIAFLNLEDINTLVFLDNNWIYHTFPIGVWGAANTFYSLAFSTSAYLMVIGFLVWGIIFLTRSASSEAQMTVKDMTRGFMIYIGGIWLGNYLFELIFTINEFLVKLALYGLQSAGIPTSISFLNLFLILQDIPSLGASLMFFMVVLSVGVLNYQYALRMLMLVILIIMFPICAYTSIFPGSRKALDMWFREFASQVFMNGGQAIGYALFLVLMKNGASNWILFAFLMGLPHITGAVRLLLGAPGGIVKGSMGLGSALALTQMVRASKGHGGGFSFKSGDTTNPSIPSSAMGIVAPTQNPLIGGVSKTMDKLSSVTPPKVKALGKMAALTTATVGGAMVGGALMGEEGVLMGAAGGMTLAKKGLTRNGKGGNEVQSSSYDGESHRLSIRLPLKPNASHEDAWAMGQNKVREGYKLNSVNLTPKGWMANMDQSKPINSTTSTPASRRVKGMTFAPMPTAPTNGQNGPAISQPNRKVGNMNVVRQPITPVSRQNPTFSNNATPTPIATPAVGNGQSQTSVPNVQVSPRARKMAYHSTQSDTVAPTTTEAPKPVQQNIPTPSRTNQPPSRS